MRKAIVSGAALKHPERYRDRTAPVGMLPIGGPYEAMTEPQRAIWAECKANMPWLHAGHRLLLRVVCVLAVKSTEPDAKAATLGALSTALSKLGATPSDESKINHAPADDDAPEEHYFTRTN